MMIEEESSTVKRARRKLKKQFDKERQLVTPQALQSMVQKIHHWIERHARERINLKEKNIALFDTNQHAANTTSKFVIHLRQKLNENIVQESSSLKGRIRRSNRS